MDIREQYDSDPTNSIFADPSIFRRSTGEKKTVGKSTSALFNELGISMVRGNNDITNGIIKVQSYLAITKHHMNPYTREFGAPRLFISRGLDFLINEMNDYYWKKDTSGEIEDRPNDKKDHACDALKYLLSKRPDIRHIIKQMQPKQVIHNSWAEMDHPNKRRKSRYAA